MKYERHYGKNRRKAAQELFEVAKNYESVKESVVYRNCYFDINHGCWRYIGKAHNYSY